MAVSVPPPPRAWSGRFTTLEGGRAFAAILVAVHHATLMAAQPRYLGAYAYGGAPVFFNAGVDFFFVLSGFIIAYVHWNDVGRPAALRGYVRARLTRIFPLYWAILIPLAAIYAVAPGLGEPRQHDPLYVATSLALWPMPQQPVLGVAWSLTYEMLFYLLFAGAVVAGRRTALLAVAWAVAIVGFGLRGGTSYPADFLLNAHNLQFLMGVTAATVLRTRTAPRPAWLLGAGAGGLAFLVGVAEPRLGLVDPLAVAAALGAASTLALVGAAELEREGRLRAPGWLASLGGASYAIYLIHVVVQSFTIRLLLKAGLRQPEALVAGLTILGVAAGLVCHRAVERPLLRALRPRPAPTLDPAPAPAS